MKLRDKMDLRTRPDGEEGALVDVWDDEQQRA